MSSNQYNSVDGHKEHFYVNRLTRALFHSDDPDFLSISTNRQESQKKAENQSERLNRHLAEDPLSRREAVSPAQLHGMKLLHEMLHYVLSKASSLKNSALLTTVREKFEESHPQQEREQYLRKFLDCFPPRDIYSGAEQPDEFLWNAGKSEAVFEESLLIWLNNQNPAFERFSAFISDSTLRKETSYRELIRVMFDSMKAMGPVGPGNTDLAEMIVMPMKHAPHSILDQLRYIRLNWADLLQDSPFWQLLDEAIAYIQDEDRYFFFENLPAPAGNRGGDWLEKAAQTPDLGPLENAPANYSPDSSWMPEVVMIAKSTYVWLDQLSKKYRRHIARLQEIPDEELDLLAERGFTALWLIGLWQRSPASQKIKQIQGNSEAKASAYALDRYDIADDLGGYDGYLCLRNRCEQRRIRLASDMVPNHTGIDSELVKNRPDWFLSSQQPPYNYTYNGPNLCSDHRYGIYIEDGYWNRSDAAVSFKRVDHSTGETRYMYHGNDGTNMPWNDTAQLNFLSAEVREGVIQQILHVARMFPIIRFDAAMVLAKRHIQRLWFPLPGNAAGIPSRSAYALSQKDFDASIPVEFWREVVDRVQREVPDTLLLAEAFWMLEGYFVRTLGMHRVYNSAFMHMLKKEDNAGYRYLIKNTLEFDAEILKRYVNFMNNPDEDTAIAQFGNGDKYFGICMMMITLPGLPMFGHGQIEGFHEKYGMEYARAYYDEQPDHNLVARHYREIFPIIKKRPLFAEVRNFFLYDVYSPEGGVNENIFAYSNRVGDEKALFVYNNAFTRAKGWIKVSAGYLLDGEIRQSTLLEGLGLGAPDDGYIVFRDHASGLEFIRSAKQLSSEGLFLSLDGYRYNLFLDFRQVRPSKLLPYDRLCEELNGKGVFGIEHAALLMSLAPLHRLITEFLDLAALSGQKNGKDEKAFGRQVSELVEEVAGIYGNLVDKELAISDTLADEAISRCRLAEQIVEENATAGSFDPLLVTHWIVFDALQQLLAANEMLKTNLVDDWLMHETLQRYYAKKGRDGIAGGSVADLFSCMLSAQEPRQGTDKETWMLDSLARLREICRYAMERLLQIEYLHEKTWFRAEGFSTLTSWLGLVLQLKAQGTEHEHPVTPSWTRDFDMEAFLSGYELGTLLSRQTRKQLIRDREQLAEHP